MAATADRFRVTIRYFLVLDRLSSSIADLDVAHLSKADRQEFVRPVGGVDAEGKQAQVAGIITRYLFGDGLAKSRGESVAAYA